MANTGAWPGPPHGAPPRAGVRSPAGRSRGAVNVTRGERGPVPSQATAAHGLCPQADGTSGPLHLHSRAGGSHDARYSAPAAWDQRRAALLRGRVSIHSETCVRLCPPYSCSWAVFQRPPGSLGPQAGLGTEDSPPGRVLPQGPAVPPTGRADVRGSSVPLLNPPCNFKSTANKAQSP